MRRRVAKVKVGQVIWRDDDLGFSEQFGQLGEVAGRPGGGQIQNPACREDGTGSERR